MKIIKVLKSKHHRTNEEESSDSEDDYQTQTKIMANATPNMMEELIEAINQIQDVLNTLKVPNTIQLPQIVMLGSQSAGKSSVLESIVHRPFLPRGQGIVTRCPLVLQLIECKKNDRKYRNDNNGTAHIEEWGEFLNKKGEIFSDFDEIRMEIERQTDKLAGSNKGICDTPINLKIFSPNVVNLTLVDLPGITKVPVGDQPEDIEDQIKDLVMKYIKNENSIILSVSAANADIATSESLKYAKLVDPEGSRTLAILTKIDLMDKGTDARDYLNNSVIHVKHGIIGIINRSQHDINENKTIDEQLKYEKSYFEKNYKEMAHRNGIPYLAKRLSTLLKEHIFECLPKLKAEIAEKMTEYSNIYSLCGEENTDHAKVIVRVITELNKNFSAIIDGIMMKKAINLKAIYGGPKFRKIFDEVFTGELIKIEPELSKAEIIHYILSNGGPRSSVFAPEIIFQKLIYEQIQRLREPSISCVDNTFDEMENVIQKLIKDQVELLRFPKLDKKVRKILKRILDKCLEKAKDSVNELIDTELSSINTNHPDFSIEEALKNKEISIGDVEIKTKKSEKDAATIEQLIKNYFPIVKKTIQDLIPKIIMHKMINYMKDKIQVELLHELFKESLEILEESEDNVMRRENAQAMIKALKSAKETVDKLETGY